MLSIESSRLAGWRLSVKDIVLQQKQYVEHNRHRAQAELGEVQEDASPIVEIVSIQEHLENGQQSTR